MKEITQKLGFQAGGALRSLTTLTQRLNSASAALAMFKAQGGQIGAGATGINKVADATDKASKKANEFVLSWATIGRVLQTQILLRGINSLVGSLGQAVERSRELGLRIAEIQTIGRGLQMTSADLTERVIVASSEIAGVSAAQFAEGVYQTLSNQVVEVGKAFDFTREAAVLAKVTMVDTKDAVNALSSVMNSYKMGAEQAEHVSNTLFATVEFGRLRLGDLANILGRVTPLTAELGIKWEEVAAATAVMTTQGTRADTALTQLRAIVSALLKPSDDLKAIFESWGVGDAKAAVATFGGLGGVLKELAKETGGSTAEMANLLKNVRAISGFFGTMTEEGSKLEDILEKITNSTNKLADAWETFKQEGAQILSKEMETYENTLTRIANEGMPTITAWWRIKNNLANNFLWAIQVINGRYTEQGKLIEKIRNTMELKNKELEAQEEILARINRKDWQEALMNVNRYYAELNKQEMNYQRIRENSMQTAKAVFESAGKNIVDVFSDAKKELEDFIKLAKDADKDAAKEVGDIDRRIAEKRLEGRLESTPDAFKGRVLQEEFSAQQRKVVEAFGKLDASQESKERALSELKILQSLASQRVQLARQVGDQRALSQARDDELAALHQEKQVVELVAEERKKALPDAQKKLAELETEEAKLKELMKLYTEKRMQLSEVTDPEARKIVEKEIADLKGQMEGIFKDVNLGMAFFESLGIGENLHLLSQELETALNEAEKDWQAEFDRAKEVFSKNVIPIRLEADPTGLIGRAADAFGMRQEPSQTTTEFNAEVIEKSIQVQKEFRDGQKQINDQQDVINKAMLTTNGILAESTRIIDEFVASGRMVRSNFEVDTLNNYVKALQQAYANVRAGQPLTEEQKFTLNELKNIAQLHNERLAAQIENYHRILVPLELISQKQQEIKQIQETTPTKEMNDAAWDAVQAHENQSDSLKDVNDKAGLARDNLIKHGEALRQNSIPATQELGSSTANVATQAEGASAKAAEIGPAAGSAIGTIMAVAQAFMAAKKAADEAAKSAAKVSPSGGGGLFYGGSPKYLAFGGRGQDRIPAMLAKKETVVSAKNSQRFFSELNSMNQGSNPVYRAQGGTVTNVGDINVTVQGGDSSQQTVREIGRALRREVQRGTIKLR